MLIRFARIDDDRLAALSPAHWREKAAKMRFRREQRQELVAGGLLVDMLGRQGPLEVRETVDGRPYLPALSEVHFSLSHSDEVVMCAVADHPVGCDVEKLAPLADGLKREIGSIEAWTFREAVFKCGVDGAKPRSVAAPSGYAAAVAVAFAGQVCRSSGSNRRFLV